MARPNDEEKVVFVELTPHQVSVLSYVVRRVQEDPDFFDVLVGGSDHHVVLVFRNAVGQIRTKLDELT